MDTSDNMRGTSESARVTTAGEARFRINIPNSKPRATRVIALDHGAETAVRELAKENWQRASFFTAAGYAEGKNEGWFAAMSGEAAELTQEIDSADLVVMVATVGAYDGAAARIGELCRAGNVMSTGLIIANDGASDSDLSKTLIQLRPYARMLVISNDDDYMQDMLLALRA